MLDTESRPNPAMFAALLAAKKAKPQATTVASRPKPAAPRPRKSRPYTTQSDGYEVARVLPAALPAEKVMPVSEPPARNVEPTVRPNFKIEDEIGNDEFGYDDGPDHEVSYVESWMPCLGAFDIDRTPRLKRSTLIDPLDPTEELDLTPEFWGFTVVSW